MFASDNRWQTVVNPRRTGRTGVEVVGAQQVPHAPILLLIHHHRGRAIGVMNVNRRIGGPIIVSGILNMDSIVASCRYAGRESCAFGPFLVVLVVAIVAAITAG